MRGISLHISAVVVCTIFVGSVFATNGSNISSPALRNSVGMGTMPQTTYRSGLVRSPNPMDRSSNMVITGNVGGGRHFRGTVPYNAISDFGGTLGSSTLDSFLRRSAVSQNYYRFGGNYTPYHSQTGTVTTTAPGISRVFTPPSTKIRTQTFNRMALQQPTPSGQTTAVKDSLDTIYTGFRPISVTNEQLETALAEQSEQSETKRLLEQRYKVKLKEFNSKLKGLNQKVSDMQQELTDKDQSVLSHESKDDGRFFEKPEDEQTGQQIYKYRKDQSETPSEKLDIYERMQQELEEFQKTYIENLSTPEEQQQQDKDKSFMEDLKTTERSSEYKQAPKRTKTKESEKGKPQKNLNDLSGAEISLKAKEVLGEHETFASYSNDKYNRYLRAAEEYMKAGKFYRADNAYSLASIYKPDDPLVYAGRSHALFAAGEYISSAFFLARTIEMFPDYPKFKIDIVTMIGSLDTVEKRIADVKERLQISELPELQFLLGYIYLQIDRTDKAREAVDAAQAILPNAPAIISLKKAVEKRANN